MVIILNTKYNHMLKIKMEKLKQPGFNVIDMVDMVDFFKTLVRLV